jgi:hypothetical protein
VRLLSAHVSSLESHRDSQRHRPVVVSTVIGVGALVTAGGAVCATSGAAGMGYRPVGAVPGTALREDSRA